ncbi:MAG: Glu-tRNA(Gln) amidotransferase subunit GatD [Nanoarchaeota archaeon]|nr:Glu-tRNA(Gln) amidotransferase subunit GatD [Nanoarchaeota archaeon]
MTYIEKIKNFSDKNIRVLDKVRVITKKEEGFDGVLIPNSEEDGLVLKLSNGYNRFVEFKNVKKIELISRGEKIASIPSIKITRKKGLPNVVLIATGGTIGTHVDYKTGGVFMCRTPEQIIATVPRISKVVNIVRMLSPFTIASEDITPEQWQEIAGMVAREVNKKSVDSVIVTVGTDTMHYLSAALSFSLQKLSKPVAVVGAQRSPDRGSFDGSMNLLCAAHYCKSKIAEVATIMHGSSEDDYCLAIRGTKVRKMHSSRRDAFRPINDLPLAKIWPNGRIEILNQRYTRRSDSKTILKTGFSKVGLIKVFPGSNPEIMDWYIKKGYKGIIIEGTGLGHVPTGESSDKTKSFDKKLSWLPWVKKAVKKGVVVAITTQTIYGRVNPYVYRNLRLLNRAGAVFCEDMHPETALVKLAWLLANHEPSQAKELIKKNFAGEISEATINKAFLY